MTAGGRNTALGIGTRLLILVSLGALAPLALLGWAASVFCHHERLKIGEKLWIIGSLLLVLRLGRIAPVFAPIGAAALATCLPTLGAAVLSRKAVVLGMSCACRHPAIAFAIASANFPDQRFGGAIILYLLLSLLIGVPYVRWNRSRTDPN